MSRPDSRSLRQALADAGSLEGRFLLGGDRPIPLAAMLAGSATDGRHSDLTGRSVLLATSDQLTAALALVEFDGLARRIVICPPDLKSENLASIIRDAGVEAIVCSVAEIYRSLGIATIVEVTVPPRSAPPPVAPQFETEWLMLTSGTTGDPKIAVHTLGALTGAIKPTPAGAEPPVWATFYDIRRYGGLQIYLRAMLGTGSLVLSRPDEPVADHLRRLAACGVTHLTGTPTHWRRALLNSAATEIKPRYIRLSGEIADQAVLDALKAAYPGTPIGHAYASTEAGVGFEVTDGLEGFPASFLDGGLAEVEMKIVDGSLRLRSARMATGYAGRPDLALIGPGGFIDSGDMVERRGERCYFAGRRDGVINVGGLKVHPEEIEALINRHGEVRMSRVKSRKSPIIGAVVVADVVLADGLTPADKERIRAELLELCQRQLAAHKIPAVFTFKPGIEATPGGKLSRHNA
ncbi:MAG: acyl--CoA ligase [Rhizobiales bacterium]|nr:acyl--CoA ligase [Hyphomicrobiales bacterium]MBI3674722.1 acyl--CoA ligase [Hyphomicrobiales bacterium]